MDSGIKEEEIGSVVVGETHTGACILLIDFK